MNFIEASLAPLKNTGQIKIHTEADFEGMRMVGRMAAQTLDMLGEFVKPGVTTGFLDDKAVEIIRDLGAVPAPLNYRGLEIHLHLHQSCRLPRHTGRQSAARRRYYECRCDALS